MQSMVAAWKALSSVENPTAGCGIVVFSGGLSTRESDVLDPDGSDEVDTKLHRPLGVSRTRCFGG